MPKPFNCASGSSRLTDSRAAGREAAELALRGVHDPRLVIALASAAHDQAAVLLGVRDVTGELPLSGGSSFAEIAPGGFRTGSVVVMVLGGAVRATLAAEPYCGPPADAGRTAARAAARELGVSPDVALLFVSAEDGQAKHVVDGVREVLGDEVPLFGGGTGLRLEGGITRLTPSRQFFHDRVVTTGVSLVLIKLEDPTARLVTAYSHGLQPISQPVTCSGADERWVSEVDGENVFDFYEKYLGRRVEDVGQFIYTYPMLVTLPGCGRTLVRVPYVIDRPNNRIGFFPDGLGQGGTVTLAHFSRGEIVRACRESAFDARQKLGDFKPRMVFAVSCNARQMFLGPRVASEARMLSEVFGTDVPVAGFYSGAEIAPGNRGSYVVAQTFCVLAVGDTAAPVAPVETASPATTRPSITIEETVRQAQEEIRRLKQQIRENEELLDLRERVLMRINRENIEVSRELRDVNSRLAELVVDHVLGKEVAGYLIESFLGAGGGGNVYRARCQKTGRTVALKMLPKTMNAMQEKRFRREVRALAKLQDRHLVPYVEGSLERPLPFLAMGLIEGHTLEQALADAVQRAQGGDAGVFPLVSATRWASGIARGLAAAHARKVLHRDLKPANVIIDGEGEAVLIDFGLARESGTASTSTVTAEGEVLGTVPYFSPEHFRGHPTAPASDVYQWGLLVHEMLTGALPYPTLDAWPALMERFEKGVQIPAPPGPALAGLARLAERCLSPMPRRRPASGAELVAELARI